MTGSSLAEPLSLKASVGVEALLAVASSRHGPEAHFQLPRGGVTEEELHDHLRDERVATDFLRGRREFHAPVERVGRTPLAKLRGIRDAAQALARGRERQYAHSLARLLGEASFAVEPDGSIRSTARGWSALADELLLPLIAIGRRRAHLKVCANPRCQWLFLDRSRNHSRIWCDPLVCGNRLHVRQFRARASGRLARRMHVSHPPRGLRGARGKEMRSVDRFRSRAALSP